ncbi:MAG: cytochrome C assembly family protein [Aeromonadaceae bacterium]
MVILSLLTLLFYLVASMAALYRLLHPRAPLWPLLGCGWSAMALHAAILGQEIVQLDAGPDLSLLNVASFVSLLISLVMSLIVHRFNGWLLLPVAYGFSALLQIANTLLPSHYVVHMNNKPELLLHIGLALLAFSLLMIASLFALLLAYLEYHLKARKRVSLPHLPPLLTVEQRVYQLIGLGVLLLTLSIGSSLFFWQELLAPEQRYKVLLTLLAWAVYVLLLWGHYRHGWRGKRLITLSLLGSLLLILAYFGSRFIQEVLLG